MQSLTFATFLTLLSAATAVPADLITRAKPTGGPASASVTVFSGPFVCANPATPPPTDGSAGPSQTVSVTEDGCAILPIPLGSAITANITATPKTGTAGCYIQIHFEAGCGLTLTNQYHGFPFDGVGVGNKVGCIQPSIRDYGAVEIVCV